MTERPHLAVIGAGPAGLAASLAAAARGVRVTLIDSAAEAGGQFYRRPAPELGARRPHRRSRTWARLEQGLADQVRAGTIEHLKDHHVWVVEGGAPGDGAPGDGGGVAGVSDADGGVLGGRTAGVDAGDGAVPGGRTAGVDVAGEGIPGGRTAGVDTVSGVAPARRTAGPVLSHAVPHPGGFAVHALLGPLQEESVVVRADAVLLAMGGYERVLPFPGWTLPGVVTAGGAQALLKGGLAVPGRTAVVAGSGPLLLPVATGLAAAGVDVAALVESAAPSAFVRRARTLAVRPDKLAEGARYAARLLRHRVPLLAHHSVVEAHGGERLAAVTVARLDTDGRVRPGTGRRIPCDTLAVGHGMLPHTDLAETLGCRVEGLRVHVDQEQRTDVPGVWAAGESTGIGGAALALAEGHIAGRSIAARLNGTEPDPRQWSAAAKSRTRLREFFAALDTACAPPAHWTEQVTDDTVVCRCEEVTGGAVRAAVTGLGAGDVRTVKLLTRAGMGWCQGRMCESAVAGLAGCEQGPVRRLFARPVPLGVLARAGDPEAGDPEAGDPETAEPETGDPETAEPEAGDPETAEPEAGDPEAGDPETADRPRSGARQQEAGPPQ